MTEILTIHSATECAALEAGTLAQAARGTAISCGATWLAGFYSANPEQELRQAMQAAARTYPHSCAFYIFSDKNTIWNWDKPTEKDKPSLMVEKETPQCGKKLAEYIQKEGLGVVAESPQARNPNTFHQIQVWVWQVDHDALSKWCKTRGVACPNTKRDLPAGAVTLGSAA